jgi:BirA family biotin operon repressor/biotin-[acetyl-CoA-carboxylase] ligase
MNSSREQILTRLSLSSSPVSGDTLASELGLSRAGIWKHIEALRKSGANIQAHTGLGYVLNSEVFSAGTLKARLTGKLIGRQIMVLEETGSTNRDIMREAEQGAEEGLAIFANHQTGGKGRMGRSWHTVTGSLACSVLLRPALPPEQVPQLSLLTAVALHDALSRFSADIRIKWPNDILYQGAKLAGILTEMRAEPGYVHAVALGFGINLQAPADGWPPDISRVAADLSTASCQKISRLNVAAAVLNALDHWYELYLRDGFAPVHAAWWQAHSSSGQKVRVFDGRQYIEGIASALDDDGALLLKTNSGMERIIAGDLELL